MIECISVYSTGCNGCVEVSSQEGKGEEDGSDTFTTGASNDLEDRKAPKQSIDKDGTGGMFLHTHTHQGKLECIIIIVSVITAWLLC